MDVKSTIDTQGGSVIEGDVVIQEGDFVGRDKTTNVFGLSWRQIIWLMSMFLVAIIILGWLIWPAPPLAQQPPLAGAFNIAVAAFGEKSDTSSTVESNVGGELGNKIYELLTVELQQEQFKSSLDIDIVGPDHVGTIVGTNSVEYYTQARQEAETLNANVLVFGTLTIGEAESIVLPELYINPDAFRNGEEAADYFELEPIRIAGNILNNPVSKNELRVQLVERVEEYLALSIGLGYLERDNYDDAAIYLTQAYTFAYKQDTKRDRSVILLLLGILANLAKEYQAAYTYYNQAVTIDPHYARALLGKGQTLFLMAASKHDCTHEGLERDKVQQALELYDEALMLPPLPYAEIQSKVALFRGHAYACLAVADDKISDWEEAQLHYEQVRRNYETNPVPLLRYLAAEASGGLALVILRQAVRDLTMASPADLTRALEVFKDATEWSRRPQRQVVFLLWQTKIHLALRDCTQAQLSFEQATAAYENYTEKNPDGAYAAPEGYYTTQATLQTCTGEGSNE